MNSNEKSKLAQKIKQELIERQKQNFKQVGKEAGGLKQNYGPLEEKKAVVSWKKLLRREVEKEEDRWTYRRANEDNYFQAGISSLDSIDMPTTEVLLDISGSVDIYLLREFLTQLKPLLKESKLKVGCFNDVFWGMVEIKSNDDIDNFEIPYNARDYIYAWNEDWDLAVRSFSKKREVNKIVFTDGFPEPGTMPGEDLKNINVIWIVYGNKAFHPCCGKVINVDVSKIMGQSSEYDDLSY